MPRLAGVVLFVYCSVLLFYYVIMFRCHRLFKCSRWLAVDKHDGMVGLILILRNPLNEVVVCVESLAIVTVTNIFTFTNILQLDCKMQPSTGSKTNFSFKVCVFTRLDN